MACVRGAQLVRERVRAPLDSSPCETFIGLVELVIRVALCVPLCDVCALRSACQQTCEACCADSVWEFLFAQRWGNPKKPPLAGASPRGMWNACFFAHLKKAQAVFLAKTLPALVRKSKRKDGLAHLQKICDALKVKYILRLGTPGVGVPFARVTKSVELSPESVLISASSACLRCSFSSSVLRAPLRLEVVARSAALGSEKILLSTCLEHAKAWGGTFASDENFDFLRSPCGRVLAGMWKTDSALAGLFVTMHHVHILSPFLADAPTGTWQSLAGGPKPDDIDSRVGLHDYSIALVLRSAKMEAFSNSFYKVEAVKNDEFGDVQVSAACVVDQTGRPCQSAAATTHGTALPARGSAKSKSGDYAASVAHFEVLAPHASGSQPPFPCVRSPQLVFQSLAFRSTLREACFLDATVFDEHGHIFWATSAAVRLETGSPPHESRLTRRHLTDVIDFDRAGEVESGQASGEMRWACLADRGAAQLLIQLEYRGSGPAMEMA
eukprot:CAMPEP_0180510130 /NCGR_PEP_ID=MMETSP1036_2-20121128/50110_1 /TAXON_ID=632150 /ORGANISM="Azadinium spinosum, Strain 3D9" /LENGTH=496 /DNA_ID=CAMNT_0022520621 /DNA_START=36 /DNA_END=1522 /DNA_ORIENTATION=+